MYYKPNTHHQSRPIKTRDFRRSFRGKWHRAVSPEPRHNGKGYTTTLKGLFYGKTSRLMQRQRHQWLLEASLNN